MKAKKTFSTKIKDGFLSPRQELEQYHALFKALPDIIYKINEGGVFIYVSEAIAELGYTPTELVGKHFKEIIHPADITSISREAVLPLYKGKNTGDEYAPKLFDERRTGIRGTKRLIIRLVPKYLKEHAQSLISEEDENQFFGEVHSYGNYLERILRRMQHVSESEMNGVLYGEVSATGHYHSRKKNTPEKFAGSVGIIRNISEKVLLSKQKARLEEQLHHSMKVEAVGQMTVGIIHDLNNVMNTCLCSAELISEKLSATLDTRMRELIGTMIGSIDNGVSLIRTLLDFTRKTQSQSAVLNGHTLLSDVIHLLEFTLESNITITHEFHAENPYFVGDPSQLQNVLVNIALNARDAMAEGGNLLFSTENRFISTMPKLPARQKSAPGEYLIMSITDNGSGMDETTHNRIFEPFYTTKPPGKGTGLGLVNVLRVMKNHKGFVDFLSASGRGATFRLYLPVTVVNTAFPKTEINDDLMAVVPVYLNARVLVIDNDAAVCEILKLTLQNAGCRVTTNTNPLKAIEAYRRHKAEFDIVLIDMLMPQCNGFECFRRLREIHSSIRAILVSGLNELIDESRIAEMGFCGSVTKPFNIRTLIHTVAQAADKSRL